MSLLLNNSGHAVLIVKYISSFLLHFSNENLQPRRKVIILLSSATKNHKRNSLKYDSRTNNPISYCPQIYIEFKIGYLTLGSQ